MRGGGGGAAVLVAFLSGPLAVLQLIRKHVKMVSGGMARISFNILTKRTTTVTHLLYVKNTRGATQNFPDFLPAEKYFSNCAVNYQQFP